MLDWDQVLRIDGITGANATIRLHDAQLASSATKAHNDILHASDHDRRRGLFTRLRGKSLSTLLKDSLAKNVTAMGALLLGL